MKIKLDKKTKIVVKPEEAVEATEIAIERIVYLPQKDTLRIICGGGLAPIETPVAADSALGVALAAAATAAVKATLK